MKRISLSTLLVSGLLMLAVQAAYANDEQSIRIKDYQPTTGTTQLVQTLKFHMWVDPLKTNWLAWSQYNQAQELNNTPLIDRPYAGNTGLNDCAVLTVIAPDGTRSPEFKMDQNDEQGRSFGQQAVIYGKKYQTPNVARSTPAGEVTLFDEGGIANSFFDDHGFGDYNFEVKVYNLHGNPGGVPTLYLVKNATEGYEVQPPIMKLPYGGTGMYYGDDGDDDDDDDDNPPDEPKFADLPMIAPFPDNPDGGGDIPGGGPFPEQNDIPIVPEPGTLALAAIGLGMMARLRRRP